MNNFNTSTSNYESDFLSEILKAENKRLIDPRYLDQLGQKYTIRVAYYLRVSTLAQATKDKVSLPEQEIQIKAKISNNDNWTIFKKYSDNGISGKNMESREGFMQMIEDAKLGKFDLILAWTTDRLARNVDEMTALRADLKKYNVQITTVKEPTEIINPRRFALQENDGLKKIMAYLLDWKAEQDNVDRVKRFEAGKMGKARKGKIPVKVPYGYKKQVHFENGDPKRKIEEDTIVENEALVVKEMFNLYDKNSWGMKKIAEHLTFKGYPAPRGGMWCYSTVKYTLQNPTYSGFVRFGWRLSKSKESRARLQQGHEGIINKGEHQKIIEPEQYKRVQEKMAIRKKLGGKAVSSRGLLTGILKCGRCGGGTYLKTFPNWFAYNKSPQERAKHKEAKAYSCSKYQNYGRSGCSKSWVIYAGKIEKIVIGKIKELANSEEARKEFAKQMKKNNTIDIKEKLTSLNNALSQLKEKNNRIKQAYINGALLLEEFTLEKHNLDNEKQNLLQEIERSQVNLVKEEKIAQQSENALFALTDFEKSWASAVFTEKKELLQILLEKVVVKENDIQIYFSD